MLCRGKRFMVARALLDDLISSRGETYARISLLIGRNPAYIQQFIKRGSPRALSVTDEATIAAYFDLAPDFLRRTGQGPVAESRPWRERSDLGQAAILRTRQAMELSDKIGASIAICYLQLALDLLETQVNAKSSSPC
jgi:hypothetical protein